MLANHVGLDIAFVFDDFLQEKMNIPMDLKVNYFYCYLYFKVITIDKFIKS